MIYLLVITIFGLLILAYQLNNKNVAAPSFLFASSFAFSSIWTMIFVNQWNFSLHGNTYVVISLGILEFIVVSHILHRFYKKFRFKLSSIVYYSSNNKMYRSIEKWKYDILLAIEVLTIALTYIEIAKLTNTLNLSKAMYIYDQTNKFTQDTLRWSWFTGNIRLAVDAIGLWSSAVIAKALSMKEKTTARLWIIFLFAIFNEFMISNRGTAIILLISVIVNYFGMKCKIKPLRLVEFLKILIGGGIGLILFERTATLLGRQVTISKGIRYFALYIAGAICNLDKFLQDRWEVHQSLGSQTFIHITTWIRDKFGMSKFILNIPFQNINGYNLGNVYTTFYDYIYDLGYIGEFIFIFVMAVISQMLFEKGILKCESRVHPTISTILYGYAGSSLIFAFFSNMFYQSFFKISMIKYLICWIILNIFIKIRIKT